MAFRSLTQQFEEYRSDYRRASGIKKRPHPALLPPGALTSDTTLEVTPLPPAWVEYKEALQRNLVEIRGLLKKLQALYNARLKVTFNEEQSAKQQREIDIITSEISKQFHNAEFNLKKVAVAGTDANTSLSYQERSTRVNVMKAAAKELQDLSKAYRAQQKDFAVRIKGQEEFGVDVMGAEDRVNVTDLLDRDSLSAEAQGQLNQLAERGSQREKEIVKLVTSINELSQLFKQLNTLVVEQGTIVDRIDYNIEKALTAVQAGNKVLKKTEKETRTPKTLLCIVSLVLVVIILLIIVVSKYS